MKLHLECVPCYVRQALDAVRMITDRKEIQEKILQESLILASDFSTEETGLLLQAKIQKMVRKAAGGNDPYKRVKQRFNNMCLEMVHDIKRTVAGSDDPFETSLRIALAGNIIDFGPKAVLNRSIIKEAIERSLTQRLSKEKILSFKQNIARASKILYIGDNAGEIVFDRIFIEGLPREKITYVVRGGPALNDVTLEDARMVKMTDTVRVITTGIDLPAAVLPLCSSSFIREYNDSDLIISKGQGNYEALSDEIKNIFFLLKIKCPVIAESLNRGYEVGDLVADRQ